MDSEVGRKMSKSANVAVGVVIAVAALGTAGAWYTGTQLDGVLRDSIDNANRQLKSSFSGTDDSMSVELVSLERHLFTSTAHYRVNVQSKNLGKNNEKIELLFVDNIEHGPLPFSRLKSLKLLPVMAASNYEIEKNAFSEKWFALTNGAAPLKGSASIGYDRATEGTLQLLPLDINDKDGMFKFSGLDLAVAASADAEKLKVTGNMDNLQLNVASEQGPVSVELHGVTFDTGGTKGASGFYLGHSNLKVASSLFQIGDKPPVRFKDFVNTSLMQEADSNLSAQVTYDIGMINYNGKDVGASQMLWKFSHFDVASTQALLHFFQEKVQPQQQAAAQAGIPFKLKLSVADQAKMNADLAKLLTAQPHIELEKISLKTANGESHFSLAVDLKNPGPLDQAPAEVGRKMIGELNAKLLLSQPMIKDVASLQASLNGLTDPNAIAEQAQGASDMVSGMAVMTQLAKVEGENVVSNLHYANEIVDFNGQKMTVQQFFSMVMSRLGGLRGTDQ